MNKEVGEWTPSLHMFGIKVISKKGVQKHHVIDKLEKILKYLESNLITESSDQISVKIFNI